ncbi:MAG: CHAT domain-containing protein, partial [Planctomycetota bacterium]
LSADERIDYFALAQRAAELSGSADDVASTAQQRFKSLLAERRTEEAYEVALALHADYPSFTYRALTLVDLASIECDLALYSDALEHLTEAEDAIPGDNSYFQRARRDVLRIRGRVYRELGLLDVARPYVEQHLSAAKELRAQGALTREVADAFVNAAASLGTGAGSYATGIRMSREMLADEELFSRFPAQRGELLSQLGLALLGGGRNAEDAALAEPELRAALALPLGVAMELRTRLRLAEAELLTGDLDAAGTELALARASIEELRGDPRRTPPLEEASDLAALEARLAFAHGAPTEELRARCEAALDELLQRWENAPERRGGTGFLIYSTRRAVLGELCRLEMALRPGEAGRERALEHLVRVQRLGSLTRDLAPTVRVSDLREDLLDEGHGLLVYLPARGGSHVFALDRESVLHTALPTSDELGRTRTDWVSHLHAFAGGVPDADRDWVVEEERRLAVRNAEHLLPPDIAARVAEWSAVTVVGADLLGTTPVEWLPLGDERFLGDRRAVDYLPSLALGVLLARRKRVATAAHDLLLVAGVNVAGEVEDAYGLGRLDLSEERAAALVGSYPNGRVLGGGEATTDGLRRALGGGVRVLQFLVHGVQDFGDERPTRLALSAAAGEDGLLGYELARALPPSDFAILTACSSGFAPDRIGDPGATDLGGAFLAGGSRAVLLSHVDLDYGEVLALSDELHAALAAGASPAESLRVARAALSADDPELAPFRCGLLAVVGLGHAEVFERPVAAQERSPSRRWIAFALGLAAVAAVGLWVAARRR